MLKEGVFLGKRYEILGRIGSGGMADVYKGKDHKLNRYVAIKVLKSDFRTDEVFIQKFLSEAQAAAGLMHPNVVNVYDVGQDRGLYYMVMELVEGITLKDYIEKKGRLTAKEAISISIQMVTGIQAAHSQHIVHRDIKPQNIIISKEGKVKVTDFGIARATTSTNTVSTSVMGSVHYTSPEQAKGGVVDEKSDIYSAGITMYEMITGHVPFDGDSTVSVAIKHINEEITPPSEEVPDIPYSLECIILKCTQKSTALRYQNCQALIQDLKHSLVDPDGRFVVLGAGAGRARVNTDATVLMDTGDLERIQKRKYAAAVYEDDYDEEEDEDYDGDDDYEYDPEDEDSGEEYRRGGRRRSNIDPNTRRIAKILMIAAAIIVVIVIGVAAVKASGIFKISPIKEAEEEAQVSVPSVVGTTEEEAKKTLSKKGLGFYVSGREASEKYEKGQIIRQDPESGTKVDKNTQINVVVSTGKEEEKVAVPNVIGKDEAVGQKELEAAELVVDSDATYSDDVEEGKIISTAPSAGAEVKAGTKVIMVVSLGPEKKTVPTITGMTAADADATLAAAGLKSGNVTEEYSNDVEAGYVISQKTEAGKKVKKDSSVDYVVSKGKKIEKVTVPPITGRKESEALQILANLGLSGNYIGEDYSDTYSAGEICYQSVPAGEQGEKGQTVIDYMISIGPRNAPGGSDNPENPGEETE